MRQPLWLCLAKPSSLQWKLFPNSRHLTWRLQVCVISSAERFLHLSANGVTPETIIKFYLLNQHLGNFWYSHFCYQFFQYSYKLYIHIGLLFCQRASWDEVKPLTLEERYAAQVSNVTVNDDAAKRRLVPDIFNSLNTDKYTQRIDDVNDLSSNTKLSITICLIVEPVIEFAIIVT